MKTGIELIAAERQRQIEIEGWTPEHDKKHDNNELAELAALYAIPDHRRYITINHFQLTFFKSLYPNNWDIRWWKPCANNRVRELTKAGALIAAEIDRIQTVEMNQKLKPPEFPPDRKESHTDPGKVW